MTVWLSREKKKKCNRGIGGENESMFTEKNTNKW